MDKYMCLDCYLITVDPQRDTIFPKSPEDVEVVKPCCDYCESFNLLLLNDYDLELLWNVALIHLGKEKASSVILKCLINK